MISLLGGDSHDRTSASRITGIENERKVLGKKLSNSDLKISLRIDEDEVQAALKDKILLSGILKDTDCICK